MDVHEPVAISRGQVIGIDFPSERRMPDICVEILEKRIHQRRDTCWRCELHLFPIAACSDTMVSNDSCYIPSILVFDTAMKYLVGLQEQLFREVLVLENELFNKESEGFGVLHHFLPCLLKYWILLVDGITNALIEKDCSAEAVGYLWWEVV